MNDINQSFINITNTVIDLHKIKSILNLGNKNINKNTFTNITYTETYNDPVDLIIISDNLDSLDEYIDKCRILLLYSDFSNKKIENYTTYSFILLDSYNDMKIYLYSKNIYIPKKIHFIWYSKGKYLDNSYPKVYKKYIDNWEKYHPDYEIIIWTRKKIEEDDKINSILGNYKYTFNNMRHIEKCDFLRYIVLYLYGGIYSDLNNMCMANITPLIINRQLGLTYETVEHNRKVIGTSTYEFISNSYLISSQYNSFWIDLIQDINDHYYINNKNPFYVIVNTGPQKLKVFTSNYFTKEQLNDVMINICYTQKYTSKFKVAEECVNTCKSPFFYKNWLDTSGWGNKYNKKIRSRTLFIMPYIFILTLFIIIMSKYRN